MNMSFCKAGNWSPYPVPISFSTSFLLPIFRLSCDTHNHQKDGQTQLWFTHHEPSSPIFQINIPFQSTFLPFGDTRDLTCCEWLGPSSVFLFMLAKDVTTLASVLRSVVESEVEADGELVGVVWTFSRMPWSKRPCLLPCGLFISPERIRERWKWDLKNRVLEAFQYVNKTYEEKGREICKKNTIKKLAKTTNQI